MSTSDYMGFSSFGPPRRGRGGGGGRRNQGRGRHGGRGRGRGGRGFRGGGRRNQGQRRNNDNRSFTDEIEELGVRSDETLCVAIQGCCHGELDAIYNRLKVQEEASGQKVDLLLCCGDFQSLRNASDYHSLAVPPKYRTLGSFHRYYSGEKQAPILTIFVGGNHEASQPLQELYYGGWVAPNIYYLGAAGVVNVAGVRIGGVSGIYKSHDYTQGRFERPPYDRSSLRSVYHVRNTDVYRLKCLAPENRIDIMLSHDWPQGIEQHGDTAALLRQKPFFREEVQRNDLGSPPNHELLQTLKPRWWFSAHLHVKFKARVNHAPSAETAAASDDSAGLVPSQVKRAPTKTEGDAQAGLVDASGSGGVGDEKVSMKESPQDETEATTTHFQSLESSKACNEPDLTDLMTQFLALDKCLPRRNHLSILHIPCNGRKDVLEYDPEWLSVLQKTHHLTSTEKRRTHCPRDVIPVTDAEIESMRAKLAERGQGNETPLAIPQNFAQTVPPQAVHNNQAPFPIMGNPQTDAFLNMLGLPHIVTVPCTNALSAPLSVQDDENEIDLDDDEDELQEGQIVLDYGNNATSVPSQAAATASVDDNEIDLDDEDDGPNDSTSDTAKAAARDDANEIDLDDDEAESASNDPENDPDASPVSKKARANS